MVKECCGCWDVEGVGFWVGYCRDALFPIDANCVGLDDG